MSYKSDFILFLLKELNSRGVPADKIAVQKAMYFLQATGAATLFQFRPHTYGPYSPDLADTLSDLCFWEKASLNCSRYELNCPRENTSLPPSVQSFIKNQLDNFIHVLNNNYSFDSFEVMGTTLHCIKAAWKSDSPPAFDKIWESFSSWKGTRYSQNTVKECYERLIELLQNDTARSL